MTGVVDPGCGCKFPLWEDSERYVFGVSLFCGEVRAKDDRTYCAEHRKVSGGRGTPGEQTAAKVLEKLSARGL